MKPVKENWLSFNIRKDEVDLFKVRKSEFVLIRDLIQKLGSRKIRENLKRRIFLIVAMKMECTLRTCCFVIFLTVVSLDIVKAQDITYHIFEEQPNSTEIGNVATDSNLFSVVGEADFSSLQFSLFDTNSRYFRIDNKTGILYTNNVLDREDICKYLETCLKTIQVAANSKLGSFFRTLKINIFINDINDHSPVFEQGPLTLEISESVASVGTTFLIKGATDEDTSQNYSLKYYELQSKDELSADEVLPFSIQFIKHLDGRSTVRLSLTSPLNREKRDQYNLEIVAKDGDDPPRTGVLPVTVIVLDVNNNPPVFKGEPYSVKVNESLGAGSRIIMVTATDKDANENGRVKYRLSPHQASDIFRYFDIGEDTGAIILKQNLKYSFGNNYRIIVEAYDNPLEGSQLTDQTEVLVTVENSENNPPDIIINLFPAENNTVKVTEYANMGTVVAYVTVIDHDAGTQGQTACIVQSGTFALERHGNYNNKFKVVTADLLDYEKRQQENVSVICQDGGSPALQSIAWFIVEIKDENDNPPLFEEENYHIAIPENTRVGEVILNVQAFDLDHGVNAQFHFIVDERFQEEFRFDEPSNPSSKTGYLRVNKELDRETRKAGYEFPIYVIDHGDHSKTGTATLSVDLDDVNDEKPNFTKSTFNFTVPENLDPGADVGKVTAIDNDLGMNKAISFNMDPVYEGQVPFRVYADGLIRTTRKLNREEIDRYDFKVVAVDKGIPPQSSSVVVLVSVGDDNDNDPEIIFPKLGDNIAFLPLSSPQWKVVTQVLAEDKDQEGKGNSKLKYAINYRNDSKLFQINPSTGQVKLAKTLPGSLEIGQKFRLDIFVSDHGEVERTAIAPLYIIIAPSNETAASHEELSNQNLLIAIIVSVVTVVVSVGIAATICIICRIDRQKKQQNSMPKNNEQDNELKERFDGSITVFSLPSEDSLVGEKKKKEVSFSLEEDVFSDDDLIQKNGLENHRHYKVSSKYLKLLPHEIPGLYIESRII